MNGTELKRFRLGLGYDRHNILQKLPVTRLGHFLPWNTTAEMNLFRCQT